MTQLPNSTGTTSLTNCTSSSGLDVNKIASDVIANLVQICAKQLFEKLSQKVKDIKTSIEVEYRSAFKKYLTCAFARYSKTKTLLYRNEPVYLYDFFECMDVLWKGKEISTCDINNIMQISHRMILVGTGGIGKTTLMKHLFLNAIENTKYIPVFIELRSFNDTEDEMECFVYSAMQIFGLSLDEDSYINSLQTGCYIFLFDGYDEVKESKTKSVFHSIQNFSERYRDNYFFISSRPTGDFTNWDSFSVLNVNALNKKQSLSLISKIDFSDIKKKERFLQDLDKSLFRKHQSFASNPLLLTMMLLTYDEHSIIPDQLNDFYEQAFLTLYNVHDSRKGYAREICSNLEYGPFKSVFAHFCFQTYFTSTFEFSENRMHELLKNTQDKLHMNFSVNGYYKDLSNLVCMLVHDGLTLRFTHRSFQEYFAAVYTVSLSDEVQRKLLRKTLQEHKRRDNYFIILYCLQENRLKKNLFFPLLKELKNKYEKNGRSDLWMLTYLYSGISIIESSYLHDSENESDKFGLLIKESSTNYVLRFVCKNMGYKYPTTTTPSEIFLMKYFNDNGMDSISFNEAERKGIMSAVIAATTWVVDEISFAFSVLEKFEHVKVPSSRELAEFVSSL